ncbi:MAG: phospho-N-acetylmuramoyl-pentapeptide-transferase [Flavobacteriales bacterium]|jgi:phospho-N-acetylmuramoyl-pentapeptide-transferase|nr:phospho-N-acetylmuramoyl-pentapeptide-transferase [Flavobacteriales bacterium]MDP4716567.1 phospho-N-acetylmuramoyl-pentapeptide-transferase [Flavobacteriales bacterium]MDP4731676.1 phospho-N-acetylmuramoyl-pentapeptide-transferase [Flavobacteriales bacterium]MDP4819049.1 phospho-N-acetylmuramoyl-pentapeptide-transferase [Flavobacteriales bacterium]MDP4951554.1 phospho-N-acetylmuramoyl-pentapeptide-transferase [Flavobacteriales bacterium]
MLYHLFEYLDKHMNFPGSGLFHYLSFRAALSILISLTISMVFGKTLIRMLRKKQVGETIRDLGLDGQMQKAGTPTMGGLIILAAILVPTLLLADLTNIYIQTMIIATIWLGLIGFLDDYIKVFKKNKEGLAGKSKIVGQIGVGVIVASMLYWNPAVTIKEKVSDVQIQNATADQQAMQWEEEKSLKTTIPFIKDNEFDYAWLVPDSMESPWVLWGVFAVIVIFIVTAVSNGANITDGIDGLATGTSAIIGITLAIFAYVSGNYIFADYLNVMYIPHSGELTVFIAAFVGACVGFLWYNSFPAQVFMGDTGSLALGGIIATFSIAIRKELLIPVLCGIFLIENLSVMLQVGYFKYTKKKYGEGRRIFLMSPLHHHYQRKGMHESKIVSRFWIIGIMLAVLTIITLKVR